MENMLTDETTTASGPVRCPICAQVNEPSRLCRHVRWTFDQGGPIDFAVFALETSPYVRARGHKASEISQVWLQMHGEWIVERVITHFDASDGYVFGDLAHLDLLARDIWKEFRPDSERPQMHRVDSF
jgi:hypothetical protein